MVIKNKKKFAIYFFFGAAFFQGCIVTKSAQISYLTNVSEINENNIIIKHEKFVDKNEIDIFSAEFPASKFSVELAKAFDKNDASDRVSNLAKQKNAILAINGGFFSIYDHKSGVKLPGYNLNTCYPNVFDPYSALPSRNLKIKEKWYGSYSEFSSAVGWNKNGRKFIVGKISTIPFIKYSAQMIRAPNLNKYIENNNFVVFTSVWGRSVSLNKKGLIVTAQKDKIIKVEKIKNTRGNIISIADNGFVFYINDIDNKYRFEKGKNISLEIKIQSENNENIETWNEVEYIISGVPYLIKNKNLNMNFPDSSFYLNAHARTAICKLENKNWLFLVANGSDEITGKSIGLGILELSKLMLDKGCTDAINLDGGHSSIFYFKGKVLNRNFPADEDNCFKLHERSVSDVIIVK